MAPSAFNDSARGLMAAIAKYRDDTAGAIVTAGTNVAYTVASYEGFDTLAHLSGQVVAFSPHATNGATVTLNVDSLGAKPLRTSPGVELLAGTIIQGTPYAALYNAVDGAFYLQGFYANPYSIPLFGGMEYWDTIAPNSSFIFPAGQALSRTGIYAPVFARWGTTYGAGDGSTTFNVPDKTGRLSAMKEATATRLTTALGGVDGGTMGASGGGQSTALATANAPAFISAGTVTTAITQAGGASAGQGIQFGSGVINVGGSGSGGAQSPLIATSTFAGNSNGGTSAPFSNVPPLIVCNYIIRVI